MFLSLVCPPSIHSVSHCLCTFVFFYQRYSRSPPAPVSPFFAYHDYTAEFSTARKFTSEHTSCYAASDSGAIPSAFDFKAYSHREYVTSASTFASEDAKVIYQSLNVAPFIKSMRELTEYVYFVKNVGFIVPARGISCVMKVYHRQSAEDVANAEYTCTVYSDNGQI